MTAITFLPAAMHLTMTWSNGGGLTHQIALDPPGADLATFVWRISMAEVRGTASFSSLVEVDRIIVILRGTLDLDLPGNSICLTKDSAPCAFPGDVAATGHARGEVVIDLNVMVRRGMASAKVRRAGAGMRLAAPTALLIATAPLHVETDGRSFPLDCYDGLRWDGYSGTPIDIVCGTGWLVEIDRAIP